MTCDSVIALNRLLENKSTTLNFELNGKIKKKIILTWESKTKNKNQENKDQIWKKKQKPRLWIKEWYWKENKSW